MLDYLADQHRYTLLLACSAFTAYEVISFRQNMVKDLTSTAQILGDNTAGAIDFNEPGRRQRRRWPELKSQPDIIGAPGDLHQKQTVVGQI